MDFKGNKEVNNIEKWRIRKSLYSLEINRVGDRYMFGDRKIPEEQFNKKFLEKIEIREIKTEVKVTEELLIAA